MISKTIYVLFGSEYVMTILMIWVLFVGVVNYTVILGYKPIQPVARDNIIININIKVTFQT